MEDERRVSVGDAILMVGREHADGPYARSCRPPHNRRIVGEVIEEAGENAFDVGWRKEGCNVLGDVLKTLTQRFLNLQNFTILNQRIKNRMEHVGEKASSRRLDVATQVREFQQRHSACSDMQNILDSNHMNI